MLNNLFKCPRLALMIMVLISLSVFSPRLYANDPSLDWKTLTTEHFIIHFANKQKQIALTTASLAETIHSNLTLRLNWSPEQKTNLVIIDSTDFANGHASPFPTNRSTLIVQPPTDTNFDYNNWLEILLIHEYTHILHLDKASGAPEFLRNIFGRFYLLFPNVFEPNWLVEGLATYMETDGLNRVGRGQSSIFSMMMRMEVDKGVKSINQINIRQSQWPYNLSYLYGEHFYRFIAETYGNDKVVELSDEYGDDIIPYFINRNSSKVLGKDLTQLWQEFVNNLNKRYRSQIENITSNAIIQGQQITQHGFNTQVVEAVEKGIVYLRNNNTEHSMLMFQNETGKSSEIIEVNSTATLDWHPKNGLLIAQPEICDNFNIYFDLYRLRPEEIFKDTPRLEKLTSCSRYRQARWSSDGKSIIALRSENSVFQLDKLTLDATLESQIWKGGLNQVISSFDVSPINQSLVASFRELGTPRLQLMALNLKDVKSEGWRVLSNEQSNSAFPRYSRDGTSLYFTSDISGVYNLYEMSLDTLKTSQLTNVVGGAFQMSESLDGKNIYYSGYHSSGYDIYQLGKQSEPTNFNTFNSKLENPVRQARATQQKLAKNSNIEAASMNSEYQANIKDYSPVESLKPSYWFPFSEAEDDNVNIGAQTSGSDALGIHHYGVALATNVDKKTIYGSANYTYSQNFGVYFERQYDFATEVGGITAYVMENNLDMIFHLPFFTMQSQWDIHAGFSSVHAKRGFYFDNTSDYNITNSFTDDVFGFGFSFNNSSRFFKSISQNDGRQVYFNAETSDLFSSDFSGETYTFDWREFIQIDNEQSLALRFVQGIGSNNTNPFRLGGQDNDLFYLRGANLNERSYALRAYDKGLEQLNGQNMQLAIAEYRFPIAWVEKTIMAPPIGLGNVSASIFYESGTTYDESPEDYYTGAGFELRTKLVAFYSLPLDLRIGYAKAFELDKGTQSYFRFGTSF